VPKPKQLPHPPLFTTLTQSPETLNWSARIGSSVVSLAANLDFIRWVFQTYVDEAAKHGRQLRFGQYSKGGGVVTVPQRCRRPHPRRGDGDGASRIGVLDALARRIRSSSKRCA
jgi:hypothetical protein